MIYNIHSFYLLPIYIYIIFLPAAHLECRQVRFGCRLRATGYTVLPFGFLPTQPHQSPEMESLCLQETEGNINPDPLGYWQKAYSIEDKPFEKFPIK